MPYPLGDINQDGVVDSIDLSLLVSAWGTSNTDADLNNDGNVDSIDLSVLIGNWGTTSNPSSPLLLDRESCIIFNPAYVNDSAEALDLEQQATTPLRNGVAYTIDPDFTAMSQWPGSGNEVVPIPGTSTEWNNKIGSEITLVALARWDGSNNVGARLISQGTGTGPGEQQYELGVRSGGPYGLRSRINVNGTRLEVEGWPGSGALNANEAFVTAVTYDGSTSRLYVARASNSWQLELIGGTNGTGTIDNGTTAPVIGNVTDGWNDSNNVWSGQIGMTGIWSRVLSLEELQLIADDPVASMEEGYMAPPAPAAAPSNVTVEDFIHSSIDLSWSSVDTASGYDIEVNGAIAHSNISTTSYAVTNLDSGTFYEMRVRAVNIGGAGPWSSPVSATTLAEPAQTTTTVMRRVERHGITWTFAQSYPVGFYANGDPFVVGGVQIIGISPAFEVEAGGWTDGTDWQKNGAMINPGPYDNTLGYGKIRANSYDEQKNVAIGLSAQSALTLQTDQSLVATIAANEANARPGLRVASVLNAVNETPPSGSFRPVYTTDKSHTTSRLASNVDTSKLLNLPHVNGSPSSLLGYISSFERCWLDHKQGWSGRKIHPSEAMPNYGRDLTSLLGQAFLAMNLDYPDSEKRQLAPYLIQIGIDFYGLAMNGQNWSPDGGHAQGRKFPILFAGALLNDSNMLAIGQANTLFGEDAQTFYVTQADVNRQLQDGNTPYEQSDIGLPEWGIRHATDPSRDNKSWGASYRTCCTTNSWHGHVLAARMMNLRSQWNHDAIFDYTDRYMYKMLADGEQGSFPRSWNRPFSEAMWDTYREDFGSVWTS